MFQFPEFAPYRLYIQRQVTASLQQGFPIQKSSDQRLFASFPKLIAGYHVFRRFSMPRHPPYTLSSLTTFIDHRHGLPQTPKLPSRWELTTATLSLALRPAPAGVLVRLPTSSC